MDWNLIQKMRQAFLDSDGHLSDYWHDQRWLSAYDQTLAERIRWKWQAVLNALSGPLAEVTGITRVVDWGCGTGIASRSFLSLGLIEKAQLSLYDRSAEAMRFAAQQIAKECPGHEVELMKKLQVPEGAFVLLVSHVLSELDASSLQDLHKLASAAALVLWVEPGRNLESRRLGQYREALLASHHILGPCRHHEACGMLQPGREKDWCHFFAPVPADVHHSAFWREFSKRMKVDLRSLPVSWLAAVRSGHYTAAQERREEALILSRPRVFKGYCRWLACTREGLCSGDFQKKHAGDIYLALSEPDFMTVMPKNQLIRMDDAPV